MEFIEAIGRIFEAIGVAAEQFGALNLIEQIFLIGVAILAGWLVLVWLRERRRRDKERRDGEIAKIRADAEARAQQAEDERNKERTQTELRIQQQTADINSRLVNAAIENNRSVVEAIGQQTAVLREIDASQKAAQQALKVVSDSATNQIGTLGEIGAALKDVRAALDQNSQRYLEQFDHLYKQYEGMPTAVSDRLRPEIAHSDAVVTALVAALENHESEVKQKLNEILVAVKGQTGSLAKAEMRGLLDDIKKAMAIHDARIEALTNSIKVLTSARTTAPSDGNPAIVNSESGTGAA